MLARLKGTSCQENKHLNKEPVLPFHNSLVYDATTAHSACCLFPKRFDFSEPVADVSFMLTLHDTYPCVFEVTLDFNHHHFHCKMMVEIKQGTKGYPEKSVCNCQTKSRSLFI